MAASPFGRPTALPFVPTFFAATVAFLGRPTFLVTRGPVTLSSLSKRVLDFYYIGLYRNYLVHSLYTSLYRYSMRLRWLFRG
jgi:branched-subunit amino acid transport protein